MTETKLKTRTNKVLQCPHCGYLEADIIRTVSRDDYVCLGCGKKKLSEFIPVEIGKVKK